MITIGFKKTSASANNIFQAIYANIFYPKQEVRFSDLNYVRRKKIEAWWQAWDIRLGKLTEAQMDFLEELAKEEAPQMILYGYTYDIDVDEIQIRYIGSKLIIINVNPNLDEALPEMIYNEEKYNESIYG
jgi:hypothetical protein